MYRYVCFITIILLFMILPEATAQPAYYHLTVDNSEEKVVQVKATFTLQDSLLYMSSNGPSPERWSEYVNGLTLRDQNDELLPVEKNKSSWITTGKTGQEVTLTYNVSITHEEREWPGGIDGVAFTTDWGYFFVGRALFIMNGDTRPLIQVEFDTPPTWKVGTPWNNYASSSLIYEVSSQEALTEAFIMVGHHHTILISKKNLAIKFLLGGDGIIAQEHAIKSLAQQTMDYFIELMGGLPSIHSDDTTTVLVTINEANQVDGEVVGSHISMLLNPQSSPQEQLVGWFMFAHEFFHLWNGKTLFVEGTRDDWFKEGLTNYYTLKALYQVDFIEEQTLLGVLNGLFYQRYQTDTGLGTLSMRDAASGFDKDNHWGLVYGGGLFAGIALDMLIREHTQNRKSMDNVIRYLYTNFGLENNAYTTDDVRRAVNTISGKNLTWFFESYIEGSKPIPIGKYLSKAGYNVSIQDRQLIAAPKPDLSPLEKQLHSGFLGDH